MHSSRPSRTRLLLLVAALGMGGLAVAQPRPAKDADLGKKSETRLDSSLAGDITRKKAESGGDAPALVYDRFRLGVEMQVASKRREQIESLSRIIGLSQDPKEAPSLLFRLGELYWEESKFFFFEANRKDDDYINAMNRKDAAAMERAKADKVELLAKQKEFQNLAVARYSEIVQKYKDFERTDEVLFFLGTTLMDAGEQRKALIAYKRLIDKYPKSKYIPDAYFAFGEYYFFNSKGKRDQLEKALEAYTRAANFPESQVYGFSLYKQGWCHFNLANYAKAKDMFKTVVLYGQYAGAAALEKDGKSSGTRNSLVKEARTDFVRAYAREGTPGDARAEFGKVASDPDDRFKMMKMLANLYYDDGKDREAALVFNTLINERPLSPDAPGFQGKIVDCVLRAGNKQMTVNQVRRLVQILQKVESSGVIKDEKDKRALEEAKELSERTLSNLAVTWHNEAKKTRDDQTFGFANEVYSDYLTLFPENPKAYDLRFFWAELLNDNLAKYETAAAQYTLVTMADAKKLEEKKPAGKWLTNSAYNAVLAWDEVVKAAENSGKIKPTVTEEGKKSAIPPQKVALLEACERYLKYVPKGDKRVEIAFKAANIYYRANHLDEAIERFSAIALNETSYKFETGERAAEIAANLVLDSYNLKGDYAKVNEWARRFYNNDKLASGAFRDELSRVLEQSSFKLVNQLEANKEYAKAAEAYLTFVSEFPKSEIADKALFNASIDFFNAKMLDRAIETRKRIIAQYPKSQFIPSCIYANAEAHEAIGDFEEAAAAYELYVRNYEKSAGPPPKVSRRRSKRSRRAAPPPKKEVTQVYEESKAQIALFNSAVFRDGLGQYKAALKLRERYLSLWPKSKDFEQIYLSIADLHEKAGAYTRAMKHLEAYQREYKDPSKVLSAEGRIAKIFADKLKNQRSARRIYERLYTYYDKLPTRLKRKLDEDALDAVARAHLLQNESVYRSYAGVRLGWGPMPSPEKKFKAGLQEKAKSLELVQKAYTQTVSFKAGDPAICALHQIGLAYQNFADMLINAPMPRGAPMELQDAIREELGNQALPVKDKAAEAFMAAVQKSRELDLFNDCSRQSLKLLRETYRPDQFPMVIEARAELRDVAAQAVGRDVLAAIQPIPKLTEAEIRANAEKREANKADLADLDQRVQQTPAANSSSGGEAAPAQEPGGSTNTYKDPFSEEPEDAQ